jgi:FdrA protein
MSERTVVELRRGAYHDSVTLLQVSRTLAGVDGVVAAQVAMGTELNLDVLREMGFDVPAEAGANDMVLALRAADDEAIVRAKEALTAALNSTSSGGGGRGLGSLPDARTTGAAARRMPGANLALVSVPGQHAFTEAMDALQAGLSVLLFSDNVSVEAEIRLKDEGARRGLLVMGPDCGTASVAGVGLGFANAVKPGPVGIVAASGTGAQQLMCMLDTVHLGVSHCLGVGGRDLTAAVGGRSTRQALAMLDDDPATELIVLVSKPPDPDVARDIVALAESLSTPVLLGLLGEGQDDLTTVAARAAERLGVTWREPWSWDDQPAPSGGGGALRGLFAGGTLCDEAMLIAAGTLGEVRSNIPLRPEWGLGPDLRSTGHLMVDFGDDALTQGRAHPMIDQRLRIDRIAVEAADPTCSVLLLDVVLGYGSHADPASELAPALAAARDTARKDGRELAMVVSLCAALDDPQDPRRQAEALHEAGAAVFVSNAAAARHAVSVAGGAR